MISRWLGSYPAVALVWLLCGAWYWSGLGQEALTLVLSIVALTFTQLVLREQNSETAHQQEKLDTIIHGVPDADDSLADNP